MFTTTLCTLEASMSLETTSILTIAQLSPFDALGLESGILRYFPPKIYTTLHTLKAHPNMCHLFLAKLLNLCQVEW